MSSSAATFGEDSSDITSFINYVLREAAADQEKKALMYKRIQYRIFEESLP